MLYRFLPETSVIEREKRVDELLQAGFSVKQHQDFLRIDGEGEIPLFGMEKMPDETLLFSSRTYHPEDTVTEVGGQKIGKDFVFIAGPCAVESYEGLLAIAEEVKKAGATFLRGGAFKPRTSPYSFQGLGIKGLDILKRVGNKVGLPVVSELTDKSYIDYFDGIDLIQIGARNMQNFELLKEVGRRKKKVLLKRGLASDINEWLFAAEYILSEGGEVILCERGVRARGGEKETNLDLGHIPFLKKKTHLPLIIDPSHAACDAEKVLTLAKESLSLGIDGMMVEVHDRPEKALCDGHHALTPKDFAVLTNYPRTQDETRIISPLPYPVFMGKNILSSVGEKIKKYLPNVKKAILVTDKNVFSLYEKTIADSLKKEGITSSTFMMAAGENSKNEQTADDLLQKAFGFDLTKDDLFVSIGGGVVGDLTGFVSSVYKRGTHFVQIPTTLLSGIDSSLGGKNGLDTVFGKNQIGTFWNPSLILFDTETIKTLSRKEWESGMGELLKYAVLCSDIFADVLHGKEEQAIKKCITFKADIVCEDYFDKGIRHILNLGHTVGHALEIASDFSVSHGEAVAFGVLAECRFAVKKGYLKEQTYQKISLIFPENKKILPSFMWKKFVFSDKKAEGDFIRLPVVFDIGDVRVMSVSIHDFMDTVE